MITKFKIYEAALSKDDGDFKYKVGDIVKYRTSKKNKYISKKMYTIVDLEVYFARRFSPPYINVKKNRYKLSDGDFALENKIRIMSQKEIEQYKLDQELDKYNL